MTNYSFFLFTNLDSVEIVKKFVEEVQTCEGDVTITSADDRYVVNAKSILGVLSINLNRPVCISFDKEEDYNMMLPFLKENFNITVQCKIAKTNEGATENGEENTYNG